MQAMNCWWVLGALVATSAAPAGGSEVLRERVERLRADFEKYKASSEERIANVRQETQDAGRLLQSGNVDVLPITQAQLDGGSEANRRLHSVVVDADYKRVKLFHEKNKVLVRGLQTSHNNAWLLICGFMVALMQAGLSLIGAGRGKSKNVQAVMLRNVIVLICVTICWWMFGWMFAFGKGDKENSPFANTHELFGIGFTNGTDDGKFEVSDKMLRWFFQWGIAALATAIVSLGISERAKITAHVAIAVVFSAWVYPVVVHWTWGNGWLSGYIWANTQMENHDGHINDVGYVDFAGSGVVFLAGAVAALVGSLIVGKRGEVGDKGVEPQPHSVPMVVLGTFFMWFGWYGLACGKALYMDKGDLSVQSGSNVMQRRAHLAGQVAVNLTLAAATSGITVFLIRFVIARRYDLDAVCNGVLAGLVSISAGCASVECGSAVGIAFVGALLYQGVSFCLGYLVDDPSDTFSVYGITGMWGLLAAPLFDWGKGTDFLNGPFGFRCTPHFDDEAKCLEGAVGQAVAANFAEMFVIIPWVGAHIALVMVVLHMLGHLRVPAVEEESGLDTAACTPMKGYDSPSDYYYHSTPRARRHD